ncbi:hypothetical protein E2C01_001112 [Portunus trituberculatus]|uniref:Secreted protein n=1 Tax=Portunus trituberculatus TaxID=210409 RepID=A0A5B7CJL3_PORTR|nr:hypothetical protein [Portunus trituberculatus]
MVKRRVSHYASFQVLSHLLLPAAAAAAAAAAARGDRQPRGCGSCLADLGGYVSLLSSEGDTGGR